MTIVSEPRVFAPGEVIAGYKIHSELSAGGTAIVYYAVGKHGDQAILKALRPERQRDPKALAAFQREIAVHREVIKDLRDAGDVYFIADYQKGDTLRSHLDKMITKHGRWADHESYAVFQQLADRLSGYEGEAVHCDLKPENIVLETVNRGYLVHIVDYGAALLEADKRTKADAGTPQYQSPEQIDPQSAHAVSSASDQYALGVMMYEAQCGRPPFVGASKEEVLRRHLEEDIDFDRLQQAGAPIAVYELIRGLLNKIPRRRPTARKVAAALDPLTHAPNAIAPAASSGIYGESEPKPRPVRSVHRWLYAAVAATTLAIGVVAFHSVAKPSMVVNYAPTPTTVAPAVAVSPLLVSAIVARPKQAVRPPKPLTARQIGQQCRWFDGTPYHCIPGGYFMDGLDAASVEELCQLIGKECSPAVKEQLMRAIPEDGEPLRTWVSTFGLGSTVTCREWAAFLERLRQREGFDIEIESVGDPPRLRYPRWQRRRIYDLYASGSCVVRDPSTFKFSVVPELADRPVEMVSWIGADSYCTDIHANLPTEAQLQRVRRWNSVWPYVWGEANPSCDQVAFDQPDEDALKLHVGECRQLPPLQKGARDVGSSPFDTIPDLGVTDLGANVRKWVRDGFVAHLPPCQGDVCIDPLMPAQPSGAYGMLGGSYTFPRYYMFAAFRGQYQGQSNEHGAGFLCVKSVPPSRRRP